MKPFLRPRLAGSESGQILTELAIFSPVFLVVIVAMISLAQTARIQATVTRAAAAASLVTVVTPGEARSEALAVLRAAIPDIQGDHVGVSIADAPQRALPFTRAARVTVTYEYTPISGFGWRPTFMLTDEFYTDRYNNAIFFEVSSPP